MTEPFFRPPPVPLGYQGYPPLPGPRPRALKAGVLGWLVFIGLAVLLVSLVQHRQPANTTIPLDTFAAKLEENQVQSLTIEPDVIDGRFVSPQSGLGPQPVTSFQVVLPDGGGTTLLPWIMEHRGIARVEAQSNGNILQQVVIPWIPWLLIFGFLWFFVFRHLRQRRQGGQQPQAVYIVNPPGLSGPPAPAAAGSDPGTGPGRGNVPPTP